MQPVRRRPLDALVAFCFLSMINKPRWDGLRGQANGGFCRVLWNEMEKKVQVCSENLEYLTDHLSLWAVAVLGEP